MDFLGKRSMSISKGVRQKLSYVDVLWRRKYGFVDYRPGFLVTLGIIVAIIVLPMEGQFYVYVGALSGIYAVASLGESALLGHAGVVSLGQGGILGVGAYWTTQLLNHGAPLIWTLLSSMVIGGLIGVVIGVPSLRLTGHTLALTTLFFALVVPEIANVWTSASGGGEGLSQSAGLVSANTVMYIIAGVLIVIMFLQIRLLNGRFGRALRLARDSERAAASFGISIKMYKVSAFVYAGILAGLAGGLFAVLTGYVAPSDFDVWVSVYIVFGAVLGGLRNPAWVILGGLFVGGLPQLVDQYLGLSSIIFGVAILLIVIPPRLPIVRRLAKLVAPKAKNNLSRSGAVNP